MWQARPDSDGLWWVRRDDGTLDIVEVKLDGWHPHSGEIMVIGCDLPNRIDERPGPWLKAEVPTCPNVTSESPAVR